MLSGSFILDIEDIKKNNYLNDWIKEYIKSEYYSLVNKMIFDPIGYDNAQKNNYISLYDMLND